jgi:hypothetical protein
MRHNLPTLLLLACVAVPAQGQTCRKVPPPFLPGLLPERVSGMPLEFATDPTGGCMSLYRPESTSERASVPWAVVTLEPNTDAALGESADSIRARYNPSGVTRPDVIVVTLGDWPVVFRPLAKGDEYVAYKGSVKVTVLVKNGDHGTVSEALAGRFFDILLPKVPCG